MAIIDHRPSPLQNTSDNIRPRLPRTGSSSRGTKKQGSDEYVLHYSASPVLGDDIPTEEECRQILLSMQAVMDREAPVLSPRFSGYRQAPAPLRSVSHAEKPALHIRIPEAPSRVAAPAVLRREENGSVCSSGSESHRSVTTKLALWKRRKASPPSRLGSLENASSWANNLNIRAKMPRLSIKRSGIKHKRRDSKDTSTACVLCRTGRPVSSGLCQSCGDDFRTPHGVFAENDNNSASWLAPPPRLDHISLHCQESSLSLSSQPSNTPLSSRAPHRQGPPPAPTTPLSDMPTPLVESRLRGSGIQKEADKDLYDEVWADYYFDDKNFLGPGDAATAADCFMRERLALDDYEAVFASPVLLSPEGSWI